MTQNELLQKLNIGPDLTAAATEWQTANSDLCVKYARLLLKGNVRSLRNAEPAAKLAVVLYALPTVYLNYKAKGIPDNIFFDTFSDVKIWCDNACEQYGVKGLVNLRWIAKHVRMKIFRIGRLQYEFSRFAILPHAGIKNIFSCPYRLGEKCVTLHVPQGEKLDNGKCIGSLRRANEFFEKFYLGYKYRCYTVITWLLNPDLTAVLGENSNITKFGRMFSMLGYVPDSDMNERRVFGYKKDRENYSPKNALQRYTLDRISKGLPLYSYNGYVAKERFADIRTI